APAFTDGIGRHVVVEHELLAELVRQAVDALLVGDGAERRRDDRLGFTALEKRGTVSPRPDAHLAVQLADVLRLAAIDADAFEDQIADDALLESRQGRLDIRLAVGRRIADWGHLRGDALRQRLDCRGAIGLARGLLDLL